MSDPNRPATLRELQEQIFAVTQRIEALETEVAELKKKGTPARVNIEKYDG